MSRKLWLSTVTVAIALLAVFAGSAVAKTGKAGAVGGTLNVDISTDVDYTDPALDYLSTGWEIEYATCLKLMNYPDANGAEGLAARPRGRGRLPEGLEQREDLRLHGQRRLHEVLERRAGDRRELQGRVRSRRRSEDAVAGGSVLLGHRRLRRSRRSRASRSRAVAPDHHPDARRAGLPRTDGDAVLLRRSRRTSRMTRTVCSRLPSAGPYYIADRVPNKSITIKKNPYYKGKRPHNVNADRLHHRQLARRDATCAPSRVRRTTPPAVSRLRRMPRPLRSTASTRASSGSSRSSA